MDEATPSTDPAEMPAPLEASSVAEDLAAEHSKADLVAAAKVQDVPVTSRDTKQDIAEKLADASGPARGPLEPDEQAVEGFFVDVVAGEHQGMFGAYQETLERDEDGTPTLILVRNRDHGGDTDLARVKFEHARPSKRTGGR